MKPMLLASFTLALCACASQPARQANNAPGTAALNCSRTVATGSILQTRKCGDSVSIERRTDYDVRALETLRQAAVTGASR